MQYRNFDIMVDTKIADGYLLRAESEIFGEARGIMTMDPSGDDIREALALLEARETDSAFLIQFGTHLYTLLFQGDIESLFQQSYGAATGEENTGLRIRLRIHPPEIGILPWELLYHPSAHGFMATSERSPLVRYLEVRQRIRSLETRFPLNVLVVIPEYIEPELALGTQMEKSHLIDIFKGLGGHVAATFLEGAVTTTRISDALMDNCYHCFHFIGHGAFEESKGYILLTNENNGIDHVDENRFAGLFQNHPTMKLVMLNSCEGAKGSSTKPMVGVAPQLVKQGIPAAIAMNYSILDDAAVLFAREFYRKLFKGWRTGRVDVALTHARNRLAHEFADHREMCTPVLFMHTREGILFNPVTGNPLKDIPFLKRDLDRSQAIAGTYIGNRAIQDTPEDSEELGRLLKRIQYRKVARIMALISAILLFFLSWVNLFDYFNLDTRIESFTIALGEYFTTKNFSREIQIIAIEDPSFGKDWRKEKYPPLLDALSREETKPRVIVFDMVFEKPTEFDDFFVDAIRRARAAGIHVVAGIRSVENKQPQIVKEIGDAVSGTGITCIGRKLGYARTAPVAVVSNAEMESRSTVYSLSLLAYSLFKGYHIHDVDFPGGHIHMLTPDRTAEVPFAETNRIEEKQLCQILQKGDMAADIFIDPYPLNVLRDPSRKMTYTQIIHSQNLARFKDGIVLIGTNHDSYTETRGFGSEKRFGYEFHAEALNTLLTGVHIYPLGAGSQFVLMILFGMAGALLRYRSQEIPGILRKVSLLSAVILYCGLIILLYARYHILSNGLYQLGAFGLAYWATGRTERRVYHEIIRKKEP